jgi:hypothetical protein
MCFDASLLIHHYYCYLLVNWQPTWALVLIHLTANAHHVGRNASLVTHHYFYFLVVHSRPILSLVISQLTANVYHVGRGDVGRGDALQLMRRQGPHVHHYILLLICQLTVSISTTDYSTHNISQRTRCWRGTTAATCITITTAHCN